MSAFHWTEISKNFSANMNETRKCSEKSFRKLSQPLVAALILKIWTPNKILTILEVSASFLLET